MRVRKLANPCLATCEVVLNALIDKIDGWIPVVVGKFDGRDINAAMKHYQSRGWFVRRHLCGSTQILMFQKMKRESNDHEPE